MKKFSYAILMIAVSIIMAGCPYESTYPIDKPSIKIQPEIIGEWRDTLNNKTYKVIQQDEFTFRIEKAKDLSDDAEYYSAYKSIVNGSTFLNIWKIQPEDSIRKYFFHKMDLLSNGSIKLSEVTDNIRERFNSSAELKKFIAGNMHNSYFFGKEELNLIRAGK